ncbi:hypothetical protein WA158_005003 [Blastocystis sp. Blastoise]
MVSFVPHNSGLGADLPNYIWTQSLNDITLTIYIDDKIRAKDVECIIEPMKLYLKLKTEDHPIINGELLQRIKVDDSMWFLDEEKGKRCIRIVLDKNNAQNYWDCVIYGDPMIDLSILNPPTSRLEDLDSSTRPAVEKIMFDQQQTARGLPTSDELKKRDILAQFSKDHPELDFSDAKIY